MTTNQWDNSGGAHRTVFLPNARFSRYSLSDLRQTQFSQEFQAVGSIPQLDYVAGLYYFNEHVSDTAATFSGGQVISKNTFSNPRSYSLEAWFKTSTTTGGKIIGFGNSPDGISNNYDRHVYMTPDGSLIYGVWVGFGETLQTAPGYNDGAWHHVVATQGAEGMRLYVDGALKGSNGQANAQDYTGYWHVGGDVTWGPG